MRLPRFRAWDGEQKKMCHRVYVGPEGWHGEYWENGSMVSCFSDDNYPDNALMEFTGLKDKNGEMIFEGDIVRQIDCPRDGDKEIFERGRWLCEWENGGFIFGGHFPTEVDASLEYEVLGNIYENPELLK